VPAVVDLIVTTNEM